MLQYSYVIVTTVIVHWDDFVFPKNNFRVLKGSPVRAQQSPGLIRNHFQASVIQPALCPPQTLIDPQLQGVFPHRGT